MAGRADRGIVPAGPPRWFFAVAAVALAWNLLGCVMVGADVWKVSTGNLTPDERLLLAARPAWAAIGSFFAVSAGAFGSLALLLRGRWAIPLLVISLLGVIVQDAGFVRMLDRVALPAAVPVLQGLVLLIAIGLLWIAIVAARRGWLR